MTKYQIIAKNDKWAKVSVGDPYDFMTTAELHRLELESMLTLVPGAEKVRLEIEPVEAA